MPFRAPDASRFEGLFRAAVLCCPPLAPYRGQRIDIISPGRRPRSADGGPEHETNPMHPPFDPLDALLDRWNETPEPPANLTPEVWRRVAVMESRAEKPGFLARVEAMFARPSFAVAFVAACMLLGLFLAEIRLSRLEAERSTQLAQSYLRLIDPLIDQTAVALNTRRP